MYIRAAIIKRVRMKEMKKWFVMILLAAVLALTSGIEAAPVTHAEYTQEEKEQAKAWLSAHGYAPTREGAAQAYQDYLNGKFDEELKDNPALQQMAPATTEVPTTEEATEETTEKEKKTEEEPAANQQDKDAASQKASSGEGTESTEETTEQPAATEEKAVKQENKQKKSKKEAAKARPVVPGIGLLVLGLVVIFFSWKRKHKR